LYILLIKWLLIIAFGVFVWLFIVHLKTKTGVSHTISSKIYNDDVQKESIHFHSGGKEENLLPLKEDVKPTEKYKNKDEKPLTEMEVYLTERLIKIKKSCGDVCKTDAKLVIKKPLDDEKLGKAGNYKNLVIQKKSIECRNLFEDSIHDKPAPEFQKEPFEYLPKSLWNDFTYQNRVLVTRYFLTDSFPSDRNSGVSTTHWNRQSIENKISLAKSQSWEQFGGNYGGTESKLLYDTILAGNVTVKNKNVLVIGSIQPWVESIFLALGANHTTTLEYNEIISDHPQTTAYLPWDLSKKYLKGDLKQKFDVMVSYSSLEHGGLGRFGDAMHPWGDLVTMAKAWCLIKDKGAAIIAVPTAKQDTIEYNAHRCYGPLLLSHLFANWNVKFASSNFAGRDPYCDHTKGYWPAHTVFVLEKN